MCFSRYSFQLKCHVFCETLPDSTTQKWFVMLCPSMSISFLLLVQYKLTYMVNYLFTCLFSFLLKTKIAFKNFISPKPPALCLVYNRCLMENNNLFSKFYSSQDAVLQNIPFYFKGIEKDIYAMSASL